VATDTGGTRELVESGQNGFIIKMKDSDDIAEKIETLIKNESLRQSMGLSSRAKAQNLSWQKVAEKYFDLYRQVTSK
jgi:N,N'-diacetylbacillosaminyl-diphospho-undecaprenol alpha-1,3-N-acetylgalactosaminyltransferase